MGPWLAWSALVLGDAPATCGCFGPGSEYPVDWWHLAANLIQMLASLEQAGFDVIKTEHLYTFDGGRAFSLGQGQ